MEQVRVNLAERSYDVRIGEGLIAGAGAEIAPLLQRPRVAVISDETVAALHLDALRDGLGVAGIEVSALTLPPGEATKCWAQLERSVDWLLEQQIERRDVVIALGGGVIGDLVGFAAAILRRGVRFVQIPTSLLAQVDSSVGGKTGVNHPLGKNMIGAFYQPQCVLIDTDSLNSLPDRELASGISEIIKYGLIRDAELFVWLEENIDRLLNRDPEAFTYAIQRSCANKAEVVAADEKEGGVRATLNLGHTFGHAIEAASGYGTWLHGEAVGTGIIMASDMSRRLGWISEELDQRVQDLIRRSRLPVVPPAGMTVDEFKSYMAVDKKVQDGTIRLILLKGELGECVITGDYDRSVLDQTLAHFCQ